MKIRFLKLVSGLVWLFTSLDPSLSSALFGSFVFFWLCFFLPQTMPDYVSFP